MATLSAMRPPDYRVLRWIYMAAGLSALGGLLLILDVETGAGWVALVGGVIFGFRAAIEYRRPVKYDDGD